MGGLWPPTTGGRVRSVQILSELSRRHSVTLVTTHGPEDDPDGLAVRLSRCHRVVSLPYAVPKRGDKRFPLAVARSWFSRYPVDLRKWRVKSVRDLVVSAIAGATPDLCVSDFLFAAANVPFGGAVPIVLFEHNVEHLIWKRLSSLERISWRRAPFEIEWRKVRAREAAACRLADLTITVSEEDRRRLAEIAPDARTAVIPTGVDTTYFSPRDAAELPAHLVFTGSMDWRPNEDAVQHFVDAILPLIRREVPDVSFMVAGRLPSEHLRGLAGQTGISVSGTVDDVRPYIAEAAVYVVPLRAGGGTRLKVFEALAMAKPVVSTTVGAEGLRLEPDRHLLVADDPRDFAQAVTSLLRDPARRRALGAAGRALVADRYSWPQVASEFESACEEVVAEHERPGAIFEQLGNHRRGRELSANGRPDLSRERSAGSGGARLMACEQYEPDRPARHS
jgi:glycosyltransferase involved in cell wall biosynthesis